jgi:glycerophosphoryl diester phosphodiesterase
VTLAIAHRGDCLGHLENTLPAIAAAVGLGADAVEVDVRLTADGVPVLHHDPDLWRLWSSPGLIEELTVAQVQAVAPQVATLTDALDCVRDSAVPLMLDVEHPATALAAHRAVRRMAAPEAAWFCGTAEALTAVREVDREIRLLLTLTDRNDPPAQVLRAVAPSHLNPFFLLLDEATVERWHRNGWGVCTWTVDDARYRAPLLDWGLDAIISNDIAGCVSDVRERAARSAGRPLTR